MEENVLLETTSEQNELNSVVTVTGGKNNPEEVAKIAQLVQMIKEESTREIALAELSRKRESFGDLALYIWYTSGIVSCLLQEITNTYSLLAPPTLNIQSSNRACNVLALFQCVAAHSETRPAFLTAQIPIFFYPFLNTVNKNKPFEYLRLTALGVIGALVKIDNPEVIGFLLSTEIIPLCLRIMERGSELSKTVATFIVQRILLDENGLNYVCNTAERFYAISSVLFNMINSNPSPRLVKHIIRSYARLSENQRVRSILKENLPPILKDKNFYQSLDESSKRWLQNLIKTLANHNINNNDRSTLGVIQGLGGGVNPGNLNTSIHNNSFGGGNPNSFDMMPINANGPYFNEYMDSSNPMQMNNYNSGNMPSNISITNNNQNYNIGHKSNFLNTHNSSLSANIVQSQHFVPKNSYMNSNVFTYKNGK